MIKKRPILADAVVAVDLSPGMEHCLDVVEQSLVETCRKVFTDNRNDIRVCAAGFNAVNSEDPHGFVQFPFTEELEELERQFRELRGQTGGDRVDSITSVLDRFICAEITEDSQKENGLEWRESRRNARLVIVITPHVYRAPAESLTVLKEQWCRSELALVLFAPDHLNYRTLAGMDKTDYYRLFDPSEKNPVKRLARDLVNLPLTDAITTAFLGSRRL